MEREKYMDREIQSGRHIHRYRNRVRELEWVKKRETGCERDKVRKKQSQTETD